MNKDIKYLIEDIVNFNPVDYSDDELIDKNTLDNILQIPRNKEELSDIIKKRIYENKFGNEKLVFPDLSDIDTSYINDMSKLFSDILRHFLIYTGYKVQLDLSSWDTSNVTNMSSMFSGCRNIVKLDLSNWNTSNVTNMSYMFDICSSLTELDLSSFDISNVTNMDYMFNDCELLQRVILPDWDTSNVESMHEAFGYCKSLRTLNISNWDISNVTDMMSMFFRCDSLTKLDISNWNVYHLNKNQLKDMFFGCNSIIIPDWYNEICYSKINENNLNFNVADYNDDEEHIINSQEIDNITNLPDIFANQLYNNAQVLFKQLDDLLIDKIMPLCPAPFTSKSPYRNIIDIYDEYQYFMFPTIDFITNCIDVSPDSRFILYDGFYYNQDKQKKQEFKKSTIKIWYNFFKSLESVKPSEMINLDLFFSVETENDLYKETYIDPKTNKEYCMDIQGFYKLIKNFFRYIEKKYKSLVSCEILDDENCHIWIPIFSKSLLNQPAQNFLNLVDEKTKLLLNIFKDYIDFLNKYLFEYIEIIL